MRQYIDKAAVVAEIEKNKNEMEPKRDWHFDEYTNGYLDALKEVLSFIDTLEVKEVDMDVLGVLAEHLLACDAHGISPKYNEKELDLLEKNE